MEFTADTVWALAVRADQINGGYAKNDVFNYDTGDAVLVKRANKILVKDWLREGAMPNEQEIEQGRECRKFFSSYTMKALMGGLNDFEKVVLKVVQKEQFTGRDLYDFAIVSSLPAAVRREQTRNELKREVFGSEALCGRVGDKIQGDILVRSCNFSSMYGKFRIVGRINESFVDFWSSFELQPERSFTIKGKIKRIRDDKTTQLNYVKVVK